MPLSDVLQEQWDHEYTDAENYTIWRRANNNVARSMAFGEPEVNDMSARCISSLVRLIDTPPCIAVILELPTSLTNVPSKASQSQCAYVLIYILCRGVRVHGALDFTDEEFAQMRRFKQRKQREMEAGLPHGDLRDMRSTWREATYRLFRLLVILVIICPLSVCLKLCDSASNPFFQGIARYHNPRKALD